MSFIEFRAATLNDANAIAQLVNFAYRPSKGEGGWTHESELVAGNRVSAQQVTDILSTAPVLVGLIDFEIIACANIVKEGKEAHIGMLAVAPALQGTGIGKRLLAEAEQYAVTMLNAEKLILIVVSARTELIAFYLRRGYQRTDAILDYPIHAGVGTPIHGALTLEVLEKPVERN